MISRRAFLTRLGKGLAAAAVLAHIPVETIPTTLHIRDYAACDYLRKAVNQWYSGHGMKWSLDRIVVGRELYEAIEDDLMHRAPHYCVFSAPAPYPLGNGLLFKGSVLTYEGLGWSVISMNGKVR